MFSALSGFVPYILVLGGLFGVLRLVRFFVKEKGGGVVKVLEIVGFFVGILLLITGVASFLGGAWSLEVWVLLVVTSLGLMLKPVSKVPFGALFGLIAGLACVVLLYWFFPLPATVFGVSSMWIYLAVFLIPALIVFVMFKFFEDLAKLFGMILGAWPVLVVLGFLCIAEGILLLFNMSLMSFFT